MILGAHCFLYVAAAWLAPLCRLFVHKVRAGEPRPDNGLAELLPTLTMERWDEAEGFWGPWFFWGGLSEVGVAGKGAVGCGSCLRGVPRNVVSRD